MVCRSLFVGLALASAWAMQSVRAAEESLEEITVQAPEPRYVAPTRRDRIGRVWVPVHINGKGPFRLVLDSGATHSAVTENVARRLGLSLTESPQAVMRGVTGSAIVDTIRVDSLEVGELYVGSSLLPIVDDAFGGAEGLLGTDGLADKRILIDFRNDFINITRSKGRQAQLGFATIPTERRAGRLLVVRARIAGVRALAIIDTGAQASVANLALRQALERRLRDGRGSADEIIGATGEMQRGVGLLISPIEIGSVHIRNAHITFGDMHIFDHWRLNDEPAVLIGMDVLGILDTLIIDYRRRELQIKLPAA